MNNYFCICLAFGGISGQICNSPNDAEICEDGCAEKYFRCLTDCNGDVACNRHRFYDSRDFCTKFRYLSYFLTRRFILF